MTRIFISHASKDDAAVTQVSGWLTVQGFDDHFVDHIHIPAGVSWDRELPSQITRAEIVLLYVTQSWLQSSECLAEYRACYFANKVIMPLLVKDQLVDLSEDEVNDLQRICSSVQGVSITDFPPDEVVSRLLSGSLVLSSTTIKNAKRKRTLHRFLIGFVSLAILLLALVFYFRDYLGDYVEKRQIRKAFSETPATDLMSLLGRPVDQRRFLECSDDKYCPEMVVLPAGSFSMGAADDMNHNSWEWPPQVIAVPHFAVSRTEITQEQWDTCFTSTQLQAGPQCKQGVSWQDNAKNPIDMVSWDDAQTYIDWLNLQTVGTSEGPYRLLSEAEWEYAARGLTSSNDSHTLYFWGDDEGDACDYANARDVEMPTFEVTRRGLRCNEPSEFVSEVGHFLPNNFGLYDMAGNLTEWVQDCWHDDYNGRPAGAVPWVRPNRSSCDRVVRGGSWVGEIDYLRAAARLKLPETGRGFNIGFRVARDLDWLQGD
ncbi:MAG: SUMF1/EgtB/PvdO family nonheme iron enzyme [Rhodobacteraceae bacterium]|nr:SUMF1/EgtB/PvdO family nonheme iron enzyme [Paracoccaceae bacterium]